VDEGQRVKHEFMLDQLHVNAGARILDIGCGWGPFLNFIRNKGYKGVGITLSDGQYNACKKKGLDVYIKDVRSLKPEDYGVFDAVVSVEAIEHFCSYEEFEAGKDESIYKHFFETVYQHLPKGGRFYLQTMTRTKKMPDRSKFDIHADIHSDAYALALTEAFLPGSWPPGGSELLIRASEPFFKVVHISKSQPDYIQTILKWRKMYRRFNLKKYALYLKILLDNIWSTKLRHLVNVFRVNPMRVCIERDYIDLYRFVFEKV
jgi:cyclopropane-fatty-acyl-phospholipid synthase